MDLDQLAARCREGDDLAWEALVRETQGRVFAIAVHYMRDREEARDAAQEAYVKVYRGLDSLDPDAPFLPWLLRLTRNCCIDRLRRLKVRTPEHEVPVNEALDTAAKEPTPEDSWLAGATRTESVLAGSAKFEDAMDPAEVARGALDHLGRGPTWVPGEANRAAARGMWPAPRVGLINAMSRATAALYDLPCADVDGVEFEHEA